MANPEIINSLTGTLGSGVSMPGSEDYDHANGSHFSAFENEVKPRCIVKPAGVGDVQKIIRALDSHLTTQECKLAIRGGGNAPFAGSANVQDGITIDMRGLKGITLSEDRSTATIAAGEMWTNVYAELEKFGLTVPGARVGRISIVGFLLGGKSSFKIDLWTEGELTM